MKDSHVLAIDQGTTATTVLVLDRELSVRGRATMELPQHFPRSGWVEHDLEEIWATTCKAVRAALEASGVGSGGIAAIGITNQRETTALWDRATGKPVGRAIVWQDRRTAGLCATLKERGFEEEIRSRTGLLLDPYFAGTKLRWMLDEDPGLRSRAEAGGLCFGTIDSFLVHRLSGGHAHVTDVTNASRTLLMNLETLRWDPVLLELLEVPAGLLPDIRSSSEVLATTAQVDGLPDGIPIAGIAGDQQAALFGQACFTPGDSKCTYGTGAFLLQHTGTAPVRSEGGLLSTVAWRLGDEPACYALEGACFVAGAAVQWLRDGLGILETAAEVETLARSVPDSGGLIFVPALAGLGAPRWRPEARGMILGIERGTTRGHLARATLEGIAMQIVELQEVMARESRQQLGSFRVDGGAAANDLLLQIQADLLGQEVIRPKMLETTALGAGFLAGLAVGVWTSLEEIAAVWKEDRRFFPEREGGWGEGLRAAWAAAVAKLP
jgi:glycerol kinase